MARRPKREEVKLILAETLDLRAARPLFDKLTACRGKDVNIDASGVARMGGQCLQLLMAAKASWEEDGRRFRFEEPSADFIGAAELLGMPSLVASGTRS